VVGWTRFGRSSGSLNSVIRLGLRERLTTPAKRDYYEVLGIARTASEHEIKTAFLKLAAEYQAQGKPANIEEVERFRVIARAYHILIDPEQRRHYDRLGEAGIIEQPLATKIDPAEVEKWAASTSNPLPVNDWSADFIAYLKNRK
jgi:DnaJ-class molecular chaperone